MPSSRQIELAMNEWLSTEGLNLPEKAVIEAMKKNAAQGWDHFVASARFLANFQSEIINSAIIKAREQGKCQCWPD